MLSFVKATYPVKVVNVDVNEDPVQPRQDLLANGLERSRERHVRRHRKNRLVVDLEGVELRQLTRDCNCP